METAAQGRFRPGTKDSFVLAGKKKKKVLEALATDYLAVIATFGFLIICI